MTKKTPPPPPLDKARLKKGSSLIEMTIALILLGAFALIAMKGSIDLTAPRRWIILQTMTDAYMGYEQAYAERISFDIINGTSAGGGQACPWVINGAPPVQITLGRLPDSSGGTTDTAGVVTFQGTDLIGTVTRTLTPDPLNIPAPATQNATPAAIAAADAAIAAAILLNPTETESWLLESHLVYQIGPNTYHKTRTVVRSR